MDNGNRKNRRLRLKPHHLIILSFLALILLGAFFLSLPVSSKNWQWTNFTDSLFTSTSCVCVTGLSSLKVNIADHFSVFGQIVMLILIQIGGLGFMMITALAMLLLGKKISYKNRLILKESISSDSTKGIIKLVKSVLIFTFVTEGIGAIILMPSLYLENGGVGIWQAVFLAVSAFCNAGFDIFTSSQSASLTGYADKPMILLPVALLVIVGGLGFIVIADIMKNKHRARRYSLHTRIVLIVTGILLVLGTAFFLGVEYHNPKTLGEGNFGVKLLSAFFQSVSARTAGFASVTQNDLTSASKMFSAVLEFIGASPGSTGGGIKTTTIALLVITVVSGIKARNDVTIGKNSVNYKNVFKAVAVMMIGLFIVFALTFFILLSEQFNADFIASGYFTLDNVIYESVAAFSTSGLSSAISPYFGAAGKLAVTLTMFCGRVGMINLGLLLFAPKSEPKIKYPESHINIG